MNKFKCNPLYKRLPRELRANAGRYISIFLLLAATILIGSSFLAVAESTLFTLNQNQIDCKVEDGQIESLIQMDEETRKQLEDEGLEVVENFYATENEYQENAKVIIFGNRDKMNMPSVFEGTLPEKEDEIAFDRLFAANREIHVNDEIILCGEKFKVTALVSFPDYNSLFKSNRDLVMNTTDFGVSYTTKEGLERFESDEITYRYSYRFLERDLTLSAQHDIEGKIKEILLKEQVPLQSFITAEKNQSISFLREDMGHDTPMVRVFVYILVGIIAFVFAVLINNTIESEAQIIGTLRASGYKKSEVVIHYLTPTILISVLASIIGNVLGYTVMIKPFENIYYKTYCISPIQLKFSVEGFLTTTVVPVVLMVAINAFMLIRKLSLSPLRFLRGDLTHKRQKKAVKLPNFSFINRFRLRVLLQNKGSYIVLFIGIFLSSFLLMFGIGLSPLMDYYVDSIDDTLPYEYQYLLKAPVEADGGEKLSLTNLKTWYNLGKMDIETTFMGIGENDSYFEDVEIPKNDDEIVIASPLAKKLGIKVGDEMLFHDDYFDKDYTFTVVGISEYSAANAAFMKQEYVNELLEKETDYFNCYISDKKLDIDDAYIAKYITRSDMLGAAEQMMESFKAVIVFINIFSVVIYMILMYLLSKSVIERNAIHISFMKVFGYNPTEIRKLYLNATTITVLTSLLVCIPLEILMFKGVLIYLSCLMEGYMEFFLPYWAYLEIIGIGAAAYFAINGLLILKVNKIPMSLALKCRD